MASSGVTSARAADRARARARAAVPEQVLTLPRGRTIAYPHDHAVTVYLREDDFGLSRYPRDLVSDLRLLHWELDGVLVVVLMLRLDRNDHFTFEHWINAAEPAGVRMLQCLAAQGDTDVVLVGDTDIRPYRVRNDIAGDASRLVARLRAHPAWTAEAFTSAVSRIGQLYPTPHALWWSSPPPIKRGRRGRAR
ncbi:MAG: hypothetical protein IPM13_14000 [Phycisphaerales bacterium]|nr:hypothetical protein [Phycisphaerales bacterium]